MGMLDINTIAEKVQQEADQDANIIFGAAISEEMNDKISVTIIATDFGNVRGSGIDGDGILTPPETPARATRGPRVTIDGLDGFEADLDQLLKESDAPSVNPAPEFDIPDFLK